MVMVFSFCISIFLQEFLVKSEPLISEAVKYAIDSSFNYVANQLNVVIETDLDESKEIFLDVIDDIMKKNWTFSLQIDVNNKIVQSTGDHNLWFIDSYEAFRRLLPWIPAYHTDSQLYYFLVLRNKVFEKSHVHDEIQSIFHDFLQFMIANVNVITETASGEVLFYTFYPYQESDCRSSKPVITQTFRNNGSIKSITPFFPPKTDNFHQCPLRIRTGNDVVLNMGNFSINNQLVNYEMSFLEAYMFTEISERMNLTLEIYTTDHSKPFKLSNNGTILRHVPQQPLVYGELDVAFGFYANTAKLIRFVSNSVPYYLTNVVITLYPHSDTLLSNAWVLVPFTSVTWICIFGSFALISGCAILIKRNTKFCRIFNLENDHPASLEILSIAIGVSVGHLPRKTNLRFCFVVLSLSTLVLRSAYQGKLFDAYRGRAMADLPHTIQELFAENYTIYAHSHYQTIVNYVNEIEYLNLQDLGIRSRAFSFLELEERIALVTSFVYIYTFYTLEERQKLVSAAILQEQICLYFQQHSVIRPNINDIVMKLEESGILHNWRKNFESINAYRLQAGDSRTAEPLVLERLTFTFYLAGALIAISCLVFLFELMFE
ncbi:uncharacterized protein LOC129952399 [Eupeodes corollae]|uniref:uncharacterized protein LOC129952399 n=1 Tax=Eupeodes corollae TaxID=290404 RepID=UPI002492CB38|nr:uncharacterized protein LOC129952399 [Eupeodes corollae]